MDDRFSGMIQAIGLTAAVAMPFWNIPLIIKIGQRKSSHDFSLWWALGVLACILLMLPSALISTDIVFKSFAIVNAILFSAVVAQIIRYR